MSNTIDKMVFYGFHSSKKEMSNGFYRGKIDKRYEDIIIDAYQNLISDYDDNLESRDFDKMAEILEKKGYFFTYVSKEPIEASAFQYDKYKYGDHLYKVYGTGDELLLNDPNELSAEVIVSKNPLYIKKVEEKMDIKELKFLIKKLINENFSVKAEDINHILSGYIECALWTEEERLNDDYLSDHESKDEDEIEDEEETELDKLIKATNVFKQKGFEGFSKEDIEPDSLIKAYTDIKKFLQLAGEEAVEEAVKEHGFAQLGHDIWLTRNHHGAGFFDRSYDYDNEKKLIDAAHALKEVDLFINDDMKLSFSNENLDESIKKNKMEKEKNNLNEIRNSIRKIIQESYEEQAWKDMDFIIKNKWNSTAKSVSGDQIDEWMKYANKELHGYGIEPIRKEGAYVDKYYYDIVGLYVNMGDTYDKTIVFDTENRQFLITSYGDFVEKLDSEEQEIPDEDNSEDF